MHKEAINVLARLYLMLSGDAAMSSVAPFPCHDLLNVCCDDALNNTMNDGDVQNLKKYSIELAQLLVLCQKHNCVQFGVDFCRSLMRKIKDIHKYKRPAPIHMIFLVDAPTTLQIQVSKCEKCPHILCLEIGKQGIQILMTCQM